MTMKEGTVLGGSYRVLKPIGTGGMGEVYEAEHTRLPRHFAVKVLRCSPDSGALGRFQQEAEITSRLVHPHIVEVVDCNVTEDQQPYLVMELLEGETLGDRLTRQRRLPPAELARIAAQIGSALAAAHAKGVVHRDLKPQNIFLARTPDGETSVKILDFGVSKLQGSSGLTQENVVVGSPRYMAPEQALGRNDELDARADIFALGVIFYEAILGERPFTARTDVEVMHQVVFEDPPRANLIDPTVPEGVAQVIARAMAKAPSDRYQSVVALVSDLEAAIAHASRAGSATGASASVPSTPRPFSTRDNGAPTVVDRPSRGSTGPATPSAGRTGPPAPPPAHQHAAAPAASAPRPRWPWLVAAGGVVCLAGAMAIVLATRHGGAPTLLQDHGTGAPAIDVRLQVTTTPAGARVLWDGVPRSDRPLVVPRDELRHRLEVRADGHLTEVRDVIPTTDQQLTFTLTRAPASQAGAGSGSGASTAGSKTGKPALTKGPTSPQSKRKGQNRMLPRPTLASWLENELAEIPSGRFKTASGIGLTFSTRTLTAKIDGWPLVRLKPVSRGAMGMEFQTPDGKNYLRWYKPTQVFFAWPGHGSLELKFVIASEPSDSRR